MKSVTKTPPVSCRFNHSPGYTDTSGEVWMYILFLQETYDAIFISWCVKQALARYQF